MKRMDMIWLRGFTATATMGLALTALLSSVAWAQPCEGDANGDGEVDPLDSGYVLARLGCKVGQGDSECDAADQNKDKKVDPLDVGYVLARLGDSCPVGACCSFLHPHCFVTTELGCEVDGGTFAGLGTDCDSDCDENETPDACELDCNKNLKPDSCEIADGQTEDCNGNGVPDECEPDCNGNGVQDQCDIAACPPGVPACSDCNGNGIPDKCDVDACGPGDFSCDCNLNGVPDSCELAACPSGVPGCDDCNINGVLDSCDIASGLSMDCNLDGVPDGCAHCLIPGDMNGDNLVNNGDVAKFNSCLANPCQIMSCECADIDRNGVVNGLDGVLFNQILSGQIPQVTLAIGDFNPKTAGQGDLITINGTGFGNCPDNLCIVAMNPGSPTAIPLQALTATDKKVTARVGALGLKDKKAPLMIAKGIGDFHPLQGAPDVKFPLGGWIWQFFGGPVGVGEVIFGDLIFAPFFPFGSGGTTCGTTNGELIDGKLCLYLEKGCPAGTKLEVYCRAWDHTDDPDFGVDGYIPCMEFTEDNTTEECAEDICAAIEELYLAQTPPVTIDCTVDAGDPDAVKLTMMYPDRPISWGRFDIIGPEIEIEINDTSATDDDYVTWAPTFCRARILGLTGLASDRTVVLTNDDPADIPDGGNVLFADYASPWPADTTATESTLTLTLPADGSWADFVIAGEFGSPSTHDKDTIIEVHGDTVDGPVCCTHELMVRVRKNANTLTDDERDRYVQAILDLHAAGDYDVFQDMHSIASSQGHGTPAFLPWHRAFVVEYERALQSVDPSVAAHYWDSTAAADYVFSADFMGTNSGDGSATGGDVTTGPFATWTIDGLTPIDRSSIRDHTGDPGVWSDASYLAETNFTDFLAVEGPHGSVHGWAGGWMGSVSTATRDPLFFLHHSNIERVWAKWQSMGHHGNSSTEYCPQGSFVCGTSTEILGSHLNDTMWPWNGLTGAGSCVTSTLDDRPASAPGGTLDPPAASGFMLGPPSIPTPDDVIDYLGRTDPTEGLGFSYDDVPYN